MKLLKFEIRICSFDIKSARNNLTTTNNLLHSMLPIDIYTNFQSTQSLKVRRIINLSKITLNNKFSNILDNQLNNIDVYYDASCVVNLNNTELPIEMTILLSFGSNFALPVSTQHCPFLKILSEIETTLTNFIHESLHNEIRARVTEKLNSFARRKQDYNKINQFILRIFRITKHFLKNNPGLMITRSDKGNKTVVMTTDDYKMKMQGLLEDSNTYIILDSDPTITLQGKNNYKIKKLHSQKMIDVETKRRMLNDIAVSPRIYGLPKYHKENVPLRPIVSTINGPNYGSAKEICNVLNNITDKEKYYIKNSYCFKSFIENVTLAPNEILVSFDVVSLFTNVPTDFAVQIVEQRWDEISNFTEISKELFIDLLKFTVNDSNYFSYNGMFYKQKFGLAMGSPLAPVLSNLVLEKLFDTMLPQLDFKPSFFKIYVDDGIFAMPRNKIDYTLSKLNSFNPHLQFTYECENPADHTLPFLDLKLHRLPSQTIRVDWYNKPTASNCLLNFYSCHDYNQKINVATAFARRDLSLSDVSFHGKNKNLISNILAKNNYPSKIITRIIKKVLVLGPITGQTSVDNNLTSASQSSLNTGRTEISRIPHNTLPNSTQTPSNNGPRFTSSTIQISSNSGRADIPRIEIENPSNLSISSSSASQPASDTERTEIPRKIYSSLHYVPKLSNSIKRTFKEKSNLDNIILAFKPVKQIKNEVHANMKDKIIPENRSGVVYKIDCLDCEQTYVGETSKKLSTRVDQHKRDFKNKLSPGPKTALITHSLDHHHKFDFQNPSILDYETNTKKRRLLEASHIIINSPKTVNIKSDTRNISTQYYNILDKYKNNRSPSRPADGDAQNHSSNPYVYPHR
jgi:hypothetical protein